ncbi:MAG: hypothetical protein MK135_03920 [Polyangiaceae bacterium]|nr:hypothetical protein [Polyangiaceae bacterium]
MNDDSNDESPVRSDDTSGGLNIDSLGEQSRYDSFAIDDSFEGRGTRENPIALKSKNGEVVEIELSVIGLLPDGSKEKVTDLTYSVDSQTIGTINPDTGVFVANGIVGGRVEVTATSKTNESLQVSYFLEINVVRTIFGDGVESDDALRFAQLIEDESRAPTIDYPLDGAVMPQNVYPANIQWANGQAGDIFRITLEKPHALVRAFLIHEGAEFKFQWLVDDLAWRGIAQTDEDEMAQITVDRYDAGATESIQSAQVVSLKFARAALTGSVYYWDIEAGLIQRINDGEGTAENFMPEPPMVDTNDCVGCHSVSNSGRYMAGRLGGGENFGTVFDLTTDLTVDRPDGLWPTNQLKWWDSTWSPDDSRLMVSAGAASSPDLLLYDPFAGTALEYEGTLPKGIMPAWGPNDDWIAFVSEADNWSAHVEASNISVLEVMGKDSFGEITQIQTGAGLMDRPESGVALSYPSWSPDGRKIVFAHGTGARSDRNDSALYAMKPDGSDVVRLERALSGANDDFQPNFSPFDEGGYFWLSFLSRRDYGNELAGTKGTERQQIWVTAIKKVTEPGEDPSAVAYWLPGQAVESSNISAFWAPRACRDDGEECSVSSECCGGECVADGEGALVCSPPPPERCRNLGQTCSSSADCCNMRECRNNVCIQDIPR